MADSLLGQQGLHLFPCLPLQISVDGSPSFPGCTQPFDSSAGILLFLELVGSEPIDHGPHPIEVRIVLGAVFIWEEAVTVYKVENRKENDVAPVVSATNITVKYVNYSTRNVIL